MLGTVDIVLVTQDADGHVGAGHGGQLDGARETLVTLRVIVLEADLELDGLEEVSLLGLEGCISAKISGLFEKSGGGGDGGNGTDSTQGAQKRSGALRRP